LLGFGGRARPFTPTPSWTRASMAERVQTPQSTMCRFDGLH
jgi:hypothetical protein